MNKQEAREFIGKEVYTVECQLKVIEKHKIVGVQSYNDNVCVLISEKGDHILSFKASLQEAENALLDYYETRLNVANEEYKEALKLVGLEY